MTVSEPLPTEVPLRRAGVLLSRTVRTPDPRVAHERLKSRNTTSKQSDVLNWMSFSLRTRAEW
jgi:hypothetical protein